MHFTKPIEIPHNKSIYQELDYNRYCQNFRTISKPSKQFESVKERKKPILLEHNICVHKKFPSNFIGKKNEKELLPQTMFKQSFALHEDELLEEMKSMIKNHKLAKQQVDFTQGQTNESCTEENRRLFVSNSLTMKFLEEQDCVLITVTEDFLLSQIVDANYHLRVGKIVKKLDFDECLVEIGNIVTPIPSFCLCLEDKILFDRMQTKRNKIMSRKSQEEIVELDVSITEEKHDINSKPKRKFKSC